MSTKLWTGDQDMTCSNVKSATEVKREKGDSHVRNLMENIVYKVAANKSNNNI